jgi:peptidoglycan/xylan/chitin deacetylase (PgdA/CDA1 family)
MIRSIMFRVFAGMLVMLTITVQLPAKILTMDTVAIGESYQADRSSVLNPEPMVMNEMADEDIAGISDFTRPQLVKLLTDNRKIILTFDDGPHPRTTPKVLEILRQRHIRAIFFVLGLQAAKYPELIKQIHDDGHLIGNHSYSHKNLAQLSEAGIKDELIRTSDLIESITGKRPEYMRPPYGAMNKNVVAIAHQQGMKITLWTVDPKDWLQKNEASILQQTDRQLGISSGRMRGGALLLHDIYPSTVRALEPLLDRLAAHEYKISSLNNLTNDSDRFWAARSPVIIRNAGFARHFDPEITGHSLLISLLKPEQKTERTSMALIKAHKNGNLFVYLMQTPCKESFEQQHSL